MADPQKFKHRITIPNELEIPFLGIYPKEERAVSQRDICTPMFKQHYSQQARGERNPGIH